MISRDISTVNALHKSNFLATKFTPFLSNLNNLLD